MDCGKTYIPFGILGSFIIRSFPFFSLPDLRLKGRENRNFSEKGWEFG